MNTQQLDAQAESPSGPRVSTDDKDQNPPNQPSPMLATIIWDLDGTLCLTPHGTDMTSIQDILEKCRPRHNLIGVARHLLRAGHPTRILTARTPPVLPATLQQVQEWFGDDAASITVEHSPRPVFQLQHWVPDKAQSIRNAPGAVKVKVGDRKEDKTAAILGGALFVWDHAVQRDGLSAFPLAVRG